MAFPLILAGPILRRVEPGLVSAWVALREAASVHLTLREGPARFDQQPVLLDGSQQPTATLRLGDQLHLAVVTLKPPAGQELRPGLVYSYDLTIIKSGAGGQPETLKSLGLLADQTDEGSGALLHLALGYEPDLLPSFSLPPAELKDLRIVHGSCRRPNNPLSDALTFVDDLIKEARGAEFALKRPHQLLLSGDQIYADDVARVHLDMLIDDAKELIGSSGFIHKERLKVEHVTELAGAPQETREFFPADHGHFPPGRRNPLIVEESRMTSNDGHSHLLSFGEFCAMYLSVWSNACWRRPEQFPHISRIWPPEPVVPAGRVPSFLANLFVDDDGRPLSADGLKQKRKGWEKSYDEEVRVLARFLAGLPKVRRALANTPTYMMFDDHEVTDDWNLNPIWLRRVLMTELGRTILRNGLLSYGLFQGWGNDPVRFESGDHRRLLELAARLFPAEADEGPDEAVAADIDVLLGLDPTGVPKITWHYSVPGQQHDLLALDNRTRRSFVSDVGPPGNVSVESQKEQIPDAPLSPGSKVLVVIAPLQVIGPPALDELIAPAAYRAFDLISHGKLESQSGTRGMTGTNPDAIEAWAFDVETFEALLKRLAEVTRPHRRVVFLSGDVHYGTSSVMSYWRRGDERPARFAQFTSSGMKNVMPSYIRFADRSLTFAQALARARIGAERLGWDDGSPDPLPGVDLVPALRSKLRKSPVLLPALALPPGTKLNPEHPPDWSWSVEPMQDERPDAERPEPARPAPLAGDVRLDSIATRNSEAYRAVAKRHAELLRDKLVNSRQILFHHNIGLITFGERTEVVGGRPETFVDAKQTLYTSFPEPVDPSTREFHGKPFTVHVIPLDAPGAARPEERFK